MSFKARTFLIAFGFCSVIYFLMLLMFSEEGHFLARVFPEGGARVLTCLGVGIVVSLLTCAGVFLFSKNVKEQNAIMEEFEKNGYSDQYLAGLQSEVNRLSTKPLSQLSYNYILQLADGYWLKRRYPEALNTINLVSPATNPQIFSALKPTGVINLLKYYDMQIAVCEPMGQMERAHNIMREATPLLNKQYGKLMTNDMFIAETFCVYSLMCGRYNDAMQHANAFFKYNNRIAKFLGFVSRARVFSYLGDKNSAYQCYNEAQALMKDKKEQDILEYLRTEYLESPRFN